MMLIDDIERNQYCFTDGNGLVSQGLAGLIAERLSLCTTDRLDDVRFVKIAVDECPTRDFS